MSKTENNLDNLTLFLKFAVLTPLTIVVSNHLGSFLPIPVVCRELSFGISSSRLWSHILLLLLIGFSVSGNIKWESTIFADSVKENPELVLLYDLLFTIFAWFFILMFLRLRYESMFFIVFFLISLSFIFFTLYKIEVEKDNGEPNENYYTTSGILFGIAVFLVFIFYLLSAYDYIQSNPKYSETQIKYIKVDNETYKASKKPTSQWRGYYQYALYGFAVIGTVLLIL